MTPMTPFVESPTGRLVELVHLLSDRPLPMAHQAVLDATERQTSDDDPWHVVATALVELKSMSEMSLWSRRQQRRLAEAAERKRALAAAT